MELNGNCYKKEEEILEIKSKRPKLKDLIPIYEPMESNGNCDKKEEEIQETKSRRPELKDFIPIYIPAVEKGLNDQSRRKRRLLDFLKAHPSKDWFLKSGFVGRISPFSFLRKNPSQKNSYNEGETTAAAARRSRFRVPFVRKINWPSIIKYCKNWIKHPMNMALLVWLLFVAAGLVVLFLLMTGILNSSIPISSERTRWTEITNQILNALFTIMCLYQYPRLVHHLVILCRWRLSDAVELRQAYSKNTVPRSYERSHMAAVVVLLHITCWSQFVYCALYWGWSSKGRPEWAANVCIVIGTGAPIIAGLYTVFSPLGRKTNVDSEPEAETNGEAQKQQQANDTDSGVRVVVTEPEWVGGLFDCWDDPTVAYLSLLCTCCVFGWNMERLGFGNMYVHVVTFVLLCVGPLLVFNVAALNITDDTLRITMRAAGVVLCFLGLFYGGFWRAQMRKKFKLPGNTFCCGYQSVTDWVQWLLCGPCSLAQEVRTGNFYEIDDNSFCSRELVGQGRAMLEPLPRDGPGTMLFSGSPDREWYDLAGSSYSSMRTAMDSSLEHLSMSMDEDMPKNERNQKMKAPLQQVVQMDDTGLPKS